MARLLIGLGAAWCAVAVAAGAFGAHALSQRLQVSALALWETASRYLMYAGVLLIVCGLTGREWPRREFDLAGTLLLIGSGIFSGTVFALALGAPRWLGAVTPIGGVLMIAALALFAWTAIRL